MFSRPQITLAPESKYVVYRNSSQKTSYGTYLEGFILLTADRIRLEFVTLDGGPHPNFPTCFGQNVITLQDCFLILERRISNQGELKLFALNRSNEIVKRRDENGVESLVRKDLDVSFALQNNGIVLGGSKGLKLTIRSPAQKTPQRPGSNQTRKKEITVQTVLQTKLSALGLKKDDVEKQSYELTQAFLRHTSIHVVKVKVSLLDENFRDLGISTISDLPVLDSVPPCTAPIQLMQVVPNAICVRGNATVAFEVMHALKGEHLKAEIVDLSGARMGETDLKVRIDNGKIGFISVPSLSNVAPGSYRLNITRNLDGIICCSSIEMTLKGHACCTCETNSDSDWSSTTSSSPVEADRTRRASKGNRRRTVNTTETSKRHKLEELNNNRIVEETSEHMDFQPTCSPTIFTMSLEPNKKTDDASSVEGLLSDDLEDLGVQDLIGFSHVAPAEDTDSNGYNAVATYLTDFSEPLLQTPDMQEFGGFFSGDNIVTDGYVKQDGHGPEDIKLSAPKPEDIKNILRDNRESGCEEGRWDDKKIEALVEDNLLAKPIIKILLFLVPAAVAMVWAAWL